MENMPKKVRSRKLNTKVDLTAMVSISFLLIIFFMITKELAKPTVMDFSLPEKNSCRGSIACINAGRIYTILLGDDDKIITYQGLLDNPLQNPKNVSYGKNGIRKELSNKKINIYNYTGDPNKGPIVIIKPSNKSNYGNLVDILDEMAITKIQTYVIDNDFTPEETKLLAAN
ncbi:ExbD/TolR family protein [Flavobacterium chungangense]|uniref:Biopolymer transporter ExbD n=1 Tax=Flavobacterium chungangense TaxID=554283 RepID=A0A6V6Z8Z5_9FLAO|nr:biopolymer transporter ExbD [Flavobacterium chungangense]CAD0008248.1 biopolymer transporter ExbD [Flavobacterium chungangense]